jgi:hypothetical protein
MRFIHLSSEPHWERHIAAMIIVAGSHSNKHKKIEYGIAQDATPTFQHP